MKPRIICIVGPTASGKSLLSIELAKKIHGEILSIDSRQIYKGMDIGTGKVTDEEKRDIPHYGLDITDPKKTYSAAAFQRYAKKTIKGIFKKNAVPILCGGTAHWMDAVVLDQKFPAVPPNKVLRKKLENKTTSQLYTQLKKLDPERAKNIDPKNPHRLIRAIEIVTATGEPIPPLKSKSAYSPIWIGIKPDPETLNKKIEKRLKKRLKQGLLAEIKKLHEAGLSWKKLEDFGLEYRYGALLLQNKITKTSFESDLLTEIKHYSKRQLTWWKRNKDIHWLVEPNLQDALRIVASAP